MKNVNFITDYREDEKCRNSFNQLAQTTFQIDFSKWFNKGYWNDKYVPYSFMNNNGEIIANASIYKMNIVIDNRSYNAIQIGTVMTANRYRQKGLSNVLMNKIIDTLKDECDFFYLFANESVLDFYPKFGFSRVDESEYRLTTNRSLRERTKNNVRKLSVDSDIQLLEAMAKNRYQNKSKISVLHNDELLMFYFLVVFPESIYYIAELEAVVIMEHEEDTLHIFDIISCKAQDIYTVLGNVLKEETEQVVFHFDPGNVEGLQVKKIPSDDDALFYLSNASIFDGHFKFPLTSHC
ncbi:GNAT family N-acetyltransferase [Shouchella lehensis]|uniref:GNAT family N-acetyltransferase n=1 Tax=Shouchella lehensis TaxID=300825 RepID=A0A4Y7WE67_9BACI|nr:GNAT family N-acetyltransferase [Shouchella lehensis]MBG9784739.1 GNAT family acetyltransferase [Shouchella lehensis]TES46141.1 GNAT family N-acetyltransferase [Shouchella lehensis]